MSVTMTQASVDAALLALAASTAFKPTTGDCWLALFENDVIPGRGSTTVLLGVTAFGGLVPKEAAGPPLVYVNPVDGSNIIRQDVDGVFETAAGSAYPKTIYGWAVLTPDKATVQYAERFVDPVVFTANGQAVVIDCSYILPASALH